MMEIFDLFKPNVERMKRKRDVKGLIKVLKGRSFRQEASVSLEEVGQPAIQHLIEALKSEEYLQVTDKIEEILEGIGEPAIQPLTQVLRDEDLVVRKSAANALRGIHWYLGMRDWLPKDVVDRAFYLAAMKKWDEAAKLGKPALEPLILALKYNNNYDDSRKIFKALVEIGEPAVEPLIQMFEEAVDHRWVPEDVLRTLGEIGGETVIKALSHALNDTKYNYIRKSIRNAIGNARSK